MNTKSFIRPFLLVLLFSFLDCMLIQHLHNQSILHRLDPDTASSDRFRDQILNQEVLDYMSGDLTDNQRTEAAALYLLETSFGRQNFSHPYNQKQFTRLEAKWKQSPHFNQYHKYVGAIWQDIKYFPVPESTTSKKLTTSFVDSWMGERNYGGKRGHEGTDIMAGKNEPGIYPVISMTDGVVSSKGWLEKGGYRIGITAPGGGYFYYAHLSSYSNLNEGDTVKAGDLLGFMGDTGYGPEGTTGQFDVHLHVGVYIYPNDQETSINPYWILKFLENHKLKYAYS